MLHKLLYIVSTVFIVGCVAFTTITSASGGEFSTDASVELTATPTKIIFAADQPGNSSKCQPTSPIVKLTAVTKNFKSKKLTYSFSTTGGRIVQSDNQLEAIWDLSGVAPGTYAVTVEANDGKVKDTKHKLEHIAYTSTTVTVEQCQ